MRRGTFRQYDHDLEADRERLQRLPDAERRIPVKLPPRPPDTMLISLARTQLHSPTKGASLFIPGDDHKGLRRILRDFDRTVTTGQLLALEYAARELDAQGETEGAEVVRGIRSDLQSHEDRIAQEYQDQGGRE